MTRRRLIPVIVGIAVLAAVGLAFFLLNNTKTTGDAELWLSQRPTGEISSVTASDMTAGKQLSLGRNGDTWALDTGEEVAQDKMAPLLATLAYLKASYRVEGAASGSSEYGLDEPSVVIDVKYADDSEDVWNIGSSQGGQGVYLSGGDTDGVYLIDSGRAEVMTGLVRDFLEVPLDQVSFDKILGIYITAVDKPQIRLNRSEAPRSGGDFFWRMFSPYSTNAEADLVSDIVSYVSDESWVQRADEGADTGLDAAALPTLNYYDQYDRELSLTLGAIAPSGDVYCNIKGLPGAYLMDGAVMKAFEIDPVDLVDRTLYYYEASSVEELVFEWKGKKLTFGAYWESTGEEGKQGQRYTLDGEVISGGDYHDFAEAVTEIKGEDKLLDGTEKLGAAVGTFEIKRVSYPYEQTIEFKEIVGRPGFLAVDYGGKTVVSVDETQLDALMEMAAAL
jgi:hypothetical protein